jgi:hypothetical protein
MKRHNYYGTGYRGATVPFVTYFIQRLTLSKM